MAQLFVEFAIILTIATLVAVIMRLLRQPLIIGHILTGLVLIALPSVLSSVFTFEHTGELIAFLSEVGIAILLFLVGINLSPKDAREVGAVAAITGFGQVIFTLALGFGLSLLLGFSLIEALYLGLALAFSSTIIIMKLLTDRGDVDTLYGRISIGFLLVQDFIAVFALILVTSIGTGGIGAVIGSVLLKTLAILIGTYLTIRFVMPLIDRLIGLSHELLFLFSITWLLALAALFTGFGFSLEIGALIAGVTLSASLHRFEISARMRPLRDFFLVLFFILVGTKLNPAMLLDSAVPIIVMSLFVLIGNPLVVMSLMGLLGHTKRIGFLSGLTVAQISEFSLILIAAGIAAGHVSEGVLGIVAMIALFTIAGSTYLILHADRIYRVLAPQLSFFERKDVKREPKKRRAADIVIFGFNRIGYSIVTSLKKAKKRYLVVDYDPVIIEQIEKAKHPALFGDVSDHEFLGSIEFSKAKMFVSTIPEVETNMLLIEKAKDENPNMIRIVTAHQLNEAKALYDHGATYVLMPHFLGGEYSASLINEHEFDVERFLELGKRHIAHLETRSRLGHEHPKYSHVERNRKT
jgi:Kef-type K+ transport system membrane component KefB/Trk K+ transport system NAD-binding subunit